MEKWFLKNNKGEPGIDYKKYNISNVLYRILINKGITTEKEIEDFLNPCLETLHSPLFLGGVIPASNLIMKSIRENVKIRIVGDYDVDGIMSTYILYTALKRIGANVSYKIPHRVYNGYGISKDIVEECIEDGVGLIITVDNGIAAFEAIEFAEESGIKVVVTDHHEPPIALVDGEMKQNLPEATYIINPKKDSDKYPFKNICGAVVAFKLATHLLTINGVPIEEVNEKLLPFAALATVCDIMPLVGENRAIVKNALSLYRDVENIGLSSLLEVLGIENKDLTAFDLGFILGPTVNSAGRLEDGSIVLDLLNSADKNSAIEIANHLKDLNYERQLKTEEAVEKAEKIIQDYNFLKTFRILVVYVENIHESICGIVAGRIKEKYNRPTIVFTDSKGIVKGSGRSIEAYNMFEELSKYKYLLESFGGHKLAAGLSLKRENLKEFVIEINNNSTLTMEDFLKNIYLDTSLQPRYVDYRLAEELKVLEPYGSGNSKPLFGCKNLVLKRASIIGKNRNVVKLQFLDDNKFVNAILFQKEEEFINYFINNCPPGTIDEVLMGNGNILLDVVYFPEINEFNGSKNLQLQVKSYKISR